jgi:non-ribosomal peptide synthetase-like protein
MDDLLHGFFRRAARLHPGRTALDVPPGRGRPERRTLTYAQLDARSDAIAARLRGLVPPEGLVAILLPRDTPDLYAAQLGVLKAGGAFVCIDTSFPDGHAAAFLEETAALLTDARGAARGLAPSIDLATIPAAAPPGPPPLLTPESLAYVIYTSGTTGRPKGVMIEHRSIANLVAHDLETFRLSPEDRVAQCSSPSYDSSVEETWFALAAGATLVVLDDETTRLGPDLAPWLRRERVTVFCPPPTLLRAMGPDADLPLVHLLYVGGEALPADLAARWASGRRLENGYGPTECTVTTTHGTVRPGAPISIGRPIRGVRAHILDEALEEVPQGEVGELCVSGLGLARGYRNLPELTAERFPTHPRLGRIYRTGDLARRDGKGDLHCLGRIDAQVKLRGYRIELEAIEATLARCEGVRAAACALQEGALVAFLVPDGAPPSAAVLKATLRDALPSYMVPARIGVLRRLPTTVSGKLDRARLPRLGGDRQGTAPRSELERRIARAFELVLKRKVSVLDDFFTELGGDSLAAAEVVTALRDDERTAGIAVRDLYEARTVAALAKRSLEATRGGPGGRRSAPPLVATIVQCAVLLGELLGGSALAYAALALVLPPALDTTGVPGLLLLLPLLAPLAMLLYAPLAVLLAVLVKKLLIGTYRPVRAPVWGSFFVRNWIVQRVAALVPWGLLQDTVLLSAALRALGARIGRRVHIDRGVNLRMGGWDLLAIGDDATICRDAALRVVDLEDGEIVVAPVEIGARATVEVRAGVSGGAALGTDAYLTPLSWLPPGARVPEGERWDGSPASPAGRAPGAPPVSGAGIAPLLHAALSVTLRLGTDVASLLPPFALYAWLARDVSDLFTWLDSSALILGVLAAGPLTLLFRALALRLVGRVEPGTMSTWSLGALRVGMKCAALEAAGTWLAGTMLWPVWLRLAGMRVGRKCEISTIMGPVPELVSIGDESFLADGIYLACPRVHRGTLTVAETRLGKGTFLGNHAVVPAGQLLPDGLFVGVATVTDHATARPGSAWFGHPPFELPRHAAATDRRLTHDPSAIRFFTRLFFELLRFALPVPSLLLFAFWCRAVAAHGLLAAPGITLATAAAACLLVVAVKWGLLGRIRPGQHAFWSCWCMRWDLLYVAWEFLARAPISTLEGTLLLPWYLRAMGARIGRRVVLGEGFAQVVDPDMLDLGDDATVQALFQAHTFEDRVLKLGRVRVRAGATVGAGAVLLYGADVGEGARVEPHGVVMKGERLLPGRTYAGSPVSSLAPSEGRNPSVRK